MVVCLPISRERRIDELSRRQAHVGIGEALVPAARLTWRKSPRRPGFPCRRCVNSTGFSAPQNAWSPATAGRQPVGLRDGQGQRHHQLPPGVRPHRPPGMGPLFLDRQPNAMGGREVGGLANMLARIWPSKTPRIGISFKRFWKAPALAGKPGLKPSTCSRRSPTADQGYLDHVHQSRRVHAGADLVRMPFEHVPLSSCLTSRRIRIQPGLRMCSLPAAGWGEKSGLRDQFGATDLQTARIPGIPGEALPDLRQLAEVGKRMGFGAAFDYALRQKSRRTCDLVGLRK